MKKTLAARGIYNANFVAQKKSWKLRALSRDVSKPLPFSNGFFDKVFCICVIEHLPSSVRRLMMKEINRVLKPGGVAAFTTDYDHQRPVSITDKGLRFAYRKKFFAEVIEPSNMTLIGNTDLLDPQPQDNFLGAFFLKKSSYL